MIIFIDILGNLVIIYFFFNIIEEVVGRLKEIIY